MTGERDAHRQGWHEGFNAGRYAPKWPWEQGGGSGSQPPPTNVSWRVACGPYVLAAVGIAIGIWLINVSLPLVITVLFGLWSLRTIWGLARIWRRLGLRTWPFAWLLVVIGFAFMLGGLAFYLYAPTAENHRQWAVVFALFGTLVAWLGAALVRRKARRTEEALATPVISRAPQLQPAAAAGQLQPTAPLPPDRYDLLKKVADLRAQGILTEEEFQAEKAKILTP